MPDVRKTDLCGGQRFSAGRGPHVPLPATTTKALQQPLRQYTGGQEPVSCCRPRWQPQSSTEPAAALESDGDTGHAWVEPCSKAWRSNRHTGDGSLLSYALVRGCDDATRLESVQVEPKWPTANWSSSTHRTRMGGAMFQGLEIQQTQREQQPVVICSCARVRC
jgi:hypothetical protein